MKCEKLAFMSCGAFEIRFESRGRTKIKSVDSISIQDDVELRFSFDFIQTREALRRAIRRF